MVESALIMPIVMLTVVALIYILLSLYNLTCLQSSAHITCERGSYYVAGSIHPNNINASETISKNDKEKVIETSMNHWITKFSLSCEDVKTKVVKQLGFSQVQVKTKGVYQKPSVWKIGTTNTNQNHLTTYYIHDEAEFIRNIDLIKDTAYAMFENVIDEAIKKQESMEWELNE